MTDAPTPAVPMLELVDVVKSYGQGETEVYALRDITLTVAPGEIVAVMGPSGCGKSTLLHLAGALEMPSAGRVRVGGHELASMSRDAQATLRRRDVGYVFQRLNLVPSLTAVENVMLPLELDGVAKRAAHDAAIDAMHLVGLTDHLEDGVEVDNLEEDAGVLDAQPAGEDDGQHEAERARDGGAGHVDRAAPRHPAEVGSLASGAVHSGRQLPTG